MVPVSVCAWLVAAALIVGTIGAVAAMYGGIAVGAARTVDGQREASDE